MQLKKVLITGGAGFVGENFVTFLSKRGKYDITIFDRFDASSYPKMPSHIHIFKGDMTLKEDLEKVFTQYGPFEVVFHLASAMPNKEFSDEMLWKINVEGARNLGEIAVLHKTKTLVFTSSNVAYGIPQHLPTTEKTPLHGLEIYGKSKAQAEKELEVFKNKINLQIIRCPVITGIGRLGLQAILFDFISDNKSVYVLGDGSNIYQFVDVLDVCSALEKASYVKGFDVYNIGANEPLPLREMYQKVIDFAKSSSKIISIPKGPALFLLALLDKLNISPLGVYQYTMLGRSLYTDTTKIKKKLQWQPKTTNAETFINNYKWYIKQQKHRFKEIGSGNISANKSVPKMGILKLVKVFS